MERTDTRERFLARFDWTLFSLVVLLCGIGLLTLYSSTYVSQIGTFYRQLIWVSGGLGLAFALGLIDYRFFERLSYAFYAVVIILLILVDVMGKTVYGSQRWLPLGPIHIQPSELAKMAIVFVLARFYAGERATPQNGYGFKELIPVYFIVGFPMMLVFLQPDLGTSLMIAFTAFTIVLFCNLRMKTLIVTVVLGASAIPSAYHFVLHEYQRDRVRTFLDPTRDPRGDGYHIIQSMISVGSGEVLGKGYLRGSQSKLEFLPKHHTDFIFSAFAEEWGFLGSLVVLGLFVILIFLGLDVVRKSKDKFGSVIAMGSLSIIIWHAIINIGMEIGLLPVVGVPLPFFSYGGSAMITNMLAVGILLSVSMRRHIF